jgi:hypothetical protein
MERYDVQEKLSLLTNYDNPSPVTFVLPFNYGPTSSTYLIAHHPVDRQEGPLEVAFPVQNATSL